MLSLFLRTRILKNRLRHRYFPVNFAKLRRTRFLQYTSRPLLLFRPSVKFRIMQLANIDNFKFDTFNATDLLSTPNANIRKSEVL